ncbi:tetratricopeptide repeat protein [Gemmatimonadota bacterium]
MRLGWNEDKERKEHGPSFSFDEVIDPDGELLEKPEYESDSGDAGDHADVPGASAGQDALSGMEPDEMLEEPTALDATAISDDEEDAEPSADKDVCDEIEDYEGDEAPEDTDGVAWHYRKGKELAACGRTHEAVEAYRQVLNLDPLHVKARNNLALVYDSLGLFDKACEELRTALDLDTRNVEVRANLGALLGEHGRFDEAEREFKRALDLAPDEPRIRFNLGLVYFRKGLYARGIPEFEKTLTLQEDHGEALYYLAQSYNLTGQYQLALKRFEALVEFDPGHHRAFWYLGMICDRLKDYDRARECYQKSYRLKEEDRGRGEPR